MTSSTSDSVRTNEASNSRRITSNDVRNAKRKPSAGSLKSTRLKSSYRSSPKELQTGDSSEHFYDHKKHVSHKDDMRDYIWRDIVR